MSLFRYIRKRKYLERVLLTPEGFAYLTVLAFIAVGSIVRNVNLLILMVGIMSAPLFINWRLAVHRIRSLRGKRQLPKRIHANEIAHVKWICENFGCSIPATNVLVREPIVRAPNDQQNLSRPTDGPSAEPKRGILYRWFGEVLERVSRRKPGQTSAVARFPRLGVGQTDIQTYQAFFTERGKYQLGPAEIYSSSPFGLIASRLRIGDGKTSFFVAPARGTLSPTWEQRVNSVAKGSESVRRRRALEEDEFFALRPWRSGDSRKNIHWRSTAKLGTPIVKQFVERNNRDFAIVLDLHTEPPAETSADCETVLSFAATALLSIGGDIEGQVAVSVCGTDSEFLSSRTLAGVLTDAMPALSVAKGSDFPDIVQGIVSCAESVSGSTPIYVISTRKQPASLASGLMVEVRNDEFDSSNGNKLDSKKRAKNRHARYISRRMRQSLPMVRWLDVGSPEFEKIFEPATIGSSQATRGESLKQVSEHWLKHAKS